MKTKVTPAFQIIVEGDYPDETAALHALRDSFIEDWVEQTGKFRIHNLKEMMVAPNVALGSLGITEIDDGVFAINNTDPGKPLTARQADGLAKALRRYDMFDSVTVEAADDVEVDGD